jgi:hypothetical protein
LPKTVRGTYKTGTALGDTNFIEVGIDVTTPGTYIVRTDTINGFSFKGTGTFSATGLTTVKLIGSGTPVIAGVTPFVIKFDTSNCTVPVTVIAGTTPPPTGSCTPTLSGRYVKDTALSAGNTVRFSHLYTAAGTYTLRSDTINGYYFTGTYTAAAAGVQNVTLTGGGTPLALGTNNFTIRFGDGTTCPLPVTVIAGIVPPPAGCSAATVQGTYTAGTALNTTNKVVIQHTYATVGTFNVTTTTVNGYSFSKSVNVTTAGIPVTVTLDGAGTPVAAGTNNFTVNFGDGTALCPFSVTVVAGTTPPSVAVYFPLTLNSYWTYTSDASTATDTIKRYISDSTIRAGNLYKIMVEEDPGTGDSVHYFFRRSVNDYMEYNYVDWYSTFFFDTDIYGDILFLKEGLASGQTWESTTWTGAVSGATRRLKYAFTCIDANATVTVGSRTFNNVYKVKFQSLIAPGASGGTFTDEGFYWDAWYAKGVGLVSLKAYDNSGTTLLFDRPIRFYQVF